MPSSQTIARLLLIVGFAFAPSIAAAQAKPAAGKPAVAKAEKEENEEKEEKGEAGEKKESVAKLPAAIKTAFSKAYPSATIKGVSTEKEDGKVVWEVESTDGGQGRDLLYSADGQVIEVEEAIETASLPAAVKAALMKAALGASILKVEHLQKGTTEAYEVQVKTAKGNKEFGFTPAGLPWKD